MIGTCEIHFELSSPYANETWRTQFVPNGIRFSDSVGPRQSWRNKCDFVTKGVASLTTYATNPVIEFWADFRECGEAFHQGGSVTTIVNWEFRPLDSDDMGQYWG